MEPADLIFRNGKVITLDTMNSMTEALAIKDGRILATGTNEEISRFAGERTEVRDLRGRAMTPGLISTHDHFLQYGLSAEFILDIRYPKIRSCEEIASAIDITLDAYEHAQRSSPRTDPRHQIVHCYFPGEEALIKIVGLGVAVNTQAPFLYWLGDSFIESVGR